MKIKIKKNGVKIKIKITSYELYKLQITPQDLIQMLEASSGLIGESKKQA